MAGILRKTNPKVIEVKNLDFLVFGYACKIFRDDDKAKEIDQGKHLIPWNGDNNQKIDRYDVRATLYDLAPYESPAGGFGNRLSYLTAEEQRAEQLCEVERYRSLYNNDEDESVYQEEFKRLENLNGEESTGYNQVQFNYDAPLDETSTGGDSKSDEVDQIYFAPKNLIVPPSIELPNTMKEHAIIERTAKFIAAENMQMEIYIKAKQSNNAQFEFLMQNHRLNSYYKFILEQFKAGTYPIEEITVENAPPDSQNTDAQDNIDMQSAVAASSIRLPIPQIKYVPSPNCAYTQLISKIKGVPLPVEPKVSVVTTPTPDKDFTPVLLQYNNSLFLENEDTQQLIEKKTISPVVVNENSNSNVEVKKFSNALMLAQSYASETEDEDEQTDEESKRPVLDFPIPPTYLLNIIDKTAGYVIKNGRQFEETLLSKQDERFFFLYPDHEFYSYYMYKMTGIPKNYAKIKEISSTTISNSQAIAAVSGCAEKENAAKTKIITPVSFSIKSKDETTTPFIKVALSQEPSDEENERMAEDNDASEMQMQTSNNADQQCSVPENVKKAIQLVESQLLARNAQITTHNSNSVKTNIAVCTPITQWPNNSPEKQLVRAPVKQDVQNQQLKEQKRADEKVKDKLAQMAREKLGLISKEKQLQLERKKRAMLFLNNIQVTSLTTASISKKEPTNGQDDKSDSDNSSVHSIPITSYGAKSDSEESVVERDIELVIAPKRRSRSITRELRSITNSQSKSRSNSRSHKHKKKSSKRSKKKSKKKSHNSSRSRSRSRSKHSSSKRTHSRSKDTASSKNLSRSCSPPLKRSKSRKLK